MTPRFVIVGFDGLRPSEVTPEEMPNLHAFAEANHVWKNYLACFPTETYVNHPAIFSGFRPKDHGLVQNWYYRRGVPEEAQLFRGSSMESVLAADALDRGIYRVPSLGERLAQNSMKMRVYCANSPGSTRLQHVHADRFAGHVCAPVHALEKTVPAVEIERMKQAGVEGAPLTFPDFTGNRMTVDAFLALDAADLETLAEVSCVWIGEPDHSQHEFGIDDARSVEARRDADRQFGRILAWWEAKGRSADVQLVVMSDHGHAVVRRHVDVTAPLVKAGFTVVNGTDLLNGADPKEADIVAVGNYTVGLWFKDRSPSVMARARDALMASPDVGMVFSRPDERRPDAIVGSVPGTFSEAVVFCDHERTPDMRFVMRGDAAAGELVMGEELPLGAGNHGGLLPQEVRAFLAVGGRRFAGRAQHEEPAGHDDLAVTIMTMLGLLDDEAALPLPTGRMLAEALGGSSAARDEACAFAAETLSLRWGEFEQRLVRAVHAGRSYVLEGGRAADDGWTPEYGCGSADNLK